MTRAAGTWTWPRGQLDLLLRAVLAPDPERALAAARSWLDRNDIDAASFREHRLLAGLAQRFGAEIAAHPAYPRLAGLARHLWARSQIAQREAAAALRALSEAMPVMAIKGASRVAVDPQSSRGRISHDIDILVRRPDMARALDMLLGMGWRYMEGESRQRLEAVAPSMRAINLGHGALGNIDLHQEAYHPLNAAPADDDALWRRAQAATFLGATLSVPSPSDRAALAIGHGALDAHAHSDWLVDCAVAQSQPDFDWRVFAETIALRRLEASAAIALGYLDGAIGIAAPDGLLSALDKAVARRPLQRLAISLQAAPRDNLSKAGNLMRGVAKLWRKRQRAQNHPEAPPPPPSIRARRRRAVGDGQSDPMLSAALKTGGACLTVRLRVAYPPVARRAVFEVNAADRHVARLVMRNWSPHARVVEGRFAIPIPASLRGKGLVIEARPSKLVRESANPAFKDANGALPFTLKVS